MAKNQTRRLNPGTLEQDRDTVAALKNIEGYAPSNSAHTVKALFSALTDTDQAEQAWAQADAARDTARDIAVAAEWLLHNLVLSARAQVEAQFGPDSNEVQAVGLKKRSTYKSRQHNGKIASVAVPAAAPA